MGTSPGAGFPQDYATVGGFASLQDGQSKALARDNEDLKPAGSLFRFGVRTLLAGVVNFFGGAMLGSWNHIRPEEITINDGQLKINGRTDLLAGVNGYCCAYQTLNITTGKTEDLGSLGIFKKWSAEERLLPYNAPVGPSKGAHVSETGIVFDEPGLWSVYVMCRRKKPSSSSSTTGNPASYVTAHVFDELGEPFANREFASGKFDADYSLNSGDQRLSGNVYQASNTSITMVFPVVIPSAGYSVAVGVRDTQRGTWWVGGTDYSTLSVLKHDNRTDNPGAATVPDEPV